MRRFFKTVAIILIGALAAAMKPVYAKADYSLVLIGGGLSFCTSQSTRECIKPLKVEPDDHVDYTYVVNPQRISELESSHWLANRLAFKSLAIEAIKLVKEQTQGVLTKRQLLTALRSVEIGPKGKTIRGADFLQSLMEREYFLILDILQNANIEENIISSNERRKVRVSVKNSKSVFSQKVLREYLTQVKSTAKTKKPKLLLVTSAQRDSFESVDLYQQIFSQLGAEVSWLPLDKATFLAIDADANNQEADECDKIEQYRQQQLGLYARDRIFPKLHKRQIDVCQDPQQILEQVKQADGLYFVDGSPTTLKTNLLAKTELSEKVVTTIKSRLAEAELVVGADEGAAMALVGESTRPSTMMIAGRSHHALLFGAVRSDVDISDCKKSASCPPGYREGQVHYTAGGVGLFPFGVIDTRFSERGRQGRLVKLLGETQQQMGFGIDERTALLVGIDIGNDIPVRMEVLGENGVAIYDASELEMDKDFGKSLLSLRSHYLTDEDKLFFRNNKIIISFADWKYSSNNRGTPVIKSGRVFNRDNFRRTLTMLCSTGATSASMKHAVVGEGHSIYVTKSRTAISLAGKRNIAGINYSYCSYRDYYVDFSPL